MLLIDYPSLKLAEAISRRWTITPLTFTGLALLARVVAAVAYADGMFVWGAVGVFAGMVFDGTDGKLARIQRRHMEQVGAFDFISDQFAVLVLAGSLIFWMSSGGMGVAILVYAWIGLYVMCLAIGSTYFRLSLYTRGNSQAASSSQTDYMPKRSGPLGRLAVAYLSAARKLAKFRLTPYSTIVDSEFVIFLVFPLIQQTWILWLAILLMIPNLAFLVGSVLYIFAMLPHDNN